MALRWEDVPHSASDPGTPRGFATFRAKVPGGWLVVVWADGTGKPPDRNFGGGLTFVPDPDHAWTVKAASDG